MRFSDYFLELLILVIYLVKDWQEVIDFSMVLLLDKNYISENYIQVIKDFIINNGFYYIFVLGVVMFYARSECGAFKIGMFLILFE